MPVFANFHVQPYLAILLAPVALWVSSGDSFAQSDTGTPSSVEWQPGPAIVKLGDQAEIKLPAGFAFADRVNTSRFLVETQNPPSGNELGTVIQKAGHWFAIFEFEAIGYVKDDEKDKLDAAKLLDSLKQGTESANEERVKRGWEPFHVTGWVKPPFYDPVTHQLTYCAVGQDDRGTRSATYRTRILGRRGVMTVELVASPDEIDSVLPVFKNAATQNFSFTTENRYSSFVKGDKVAEYGLSALVLGGAAAAAAKTGLLKWVFKLLVVGWKVVAAALAAVLAFLRKLFGGRREPEAAASQTASE